MADRNGHGRVSLAWSVAAAIPLGSAALLVLWLRRRRPKQQADDYEEWWRHRERVRANGDAAGRSELFV